MSDFATKEYFQLHQQRFEAALMFATNKIWIDGEYREAPIYKAVELADELMLKLRKTSELTPEE